MNTDILGRDAGTWREDVTSSSLQMFEWRFILLPQLSHSGARQLKLQTSVGLQDTRLGWHPLCAPLGQDGLRLSAPCTHGRGQLAQPRAWAGGGMWWMSSFCIFLPVRLNRAFELFPYQKWDEMLWPAHFSCRHMYVSAFFLPRAGSVTHSSGGEELLYAVSVSSTASGSVGFTACVMWLLEHIHTLQLSVISMCLKATEW